MVNRLHHLALWYNSDLAHVTWNILHNKIQHFQTTFICDVSYVCIFPTSQITAIRRFHATCNDDVANICLNLFNLTCSGNYSLRDYFSISIGLHLLRHLVPNSFVFHSDFRHQQVNNQKFRGHILINISVRKVFLSVRN